MIIRQVFFSLAVWAAGVAFTTLLYIVMLILCAVFPFDKKRKIVHAQCFWWADILIALNPCWQFTVSGLENIDRKKAYVIVANHQSFADTVIIYKTKMQFKWVAKDSLFKVPILGWAMSLAKHIRLLRGDFSSIKKVYRETAECLRGGMSVLFFPEGTRSTTGDMRDFQNGAFKLAIKEKVPILPISIWGTGAIMPKGSWNFKSRMPVGLKILPAIDTTAFHACEFASLRDLVRAKLEEA